MTKIKRIQPWRRFASVVQAVIIIGLPFLRIRGESALRFDIPSLRLHFFGASVWMEEFFIVLIAIIFLTFLFVFITLMFGRIWCGWACPQAVLIDLTPFADKAKSKGMPYRLGAYSAVLLASAVVAADLIWYFVSPYEFIQGLAAGSPGNVVWGFWIVITGIIFLDISLLRHKFCATVCPYAKLQSALFDGKTLVIAFDPGRKDECMKCMACVRACPVGIDIRDGLDSACVSCAECVDSCAKVMGPGGKKSLIGYFFGLPGETGGILRQNAIITGSVTAVFLVFFIYLLITRALFDMTVLPNYSYPPRFEAGAGVINSYILSVTNRGRDDAVVTVEAKAQNSIAEVVPARVPVRAGEMKKIAVYVAFRNSGKIRTIKNIDISIGSLKPGRVLVTKQARFIYPDGG
ncbi:MAG: 4Fe-4S binding protein [Nitrospiraceae bacterium]|nr:MAG: 4Fe-4S binding protein [Nitrospiraceae bacterium]